MRKKLNSLTKTKDEITPESLQKAKSTLKKVSQHQVLNLGDRRTGSPTKESSISRKLGSLVGGVPLDKEHLPDAKGIIDIVGHSSKTIDLKSGKEIYQIEGEDAQGLAEMLKHEYGLEKIKTLNLVSCESEQFMSDLKTALKGLGVEVETIKGAKGRVAVDRATGQMLDEAKVGNLARIKEHDGSLGEEEMETDTTSQSELQDKQLEEIRANLQDVRGLLDTAKSLEDLKNIEDKLFQIYQPLATLVGKDKGLFKDKEKELVREFAIVFGQNSLAQGNPENLIRSGIWLRNAGDLDTSRKVFIDAAKLGKETKNAQILDLAVKGLLQSNINPTHALEYAREAIEVALNKGELRAALGLAGALLDGGAPLIATDYAIGIANRIPKENPTLEHLQILNDIANGISKYNSKEAKNMAHAVINKTDDAKLALRAAELLSELGGSEEALITATKVAEKAIEQGNFDLALNATNMLAFSQRKAFELQAIPLLEQIGEKVINDQSLLLNTITQLLDIENPKADRVALPLCVQLAQQPFSSKDLASYASTQLLKAVKRPANFQSENATMAAILACELARKAGHSNNAIEATQLLKKLGDQKHASKFAIQVMADYEDRTTIFKEMGDSSDVLGALKDRVKSVKAVFDTGAAGDLDGLRSYIFKQVDPIFTEALEQSDFEILHEVVNICRYIGLDSSTYSQSISLKAIEEYKAAMKEGDFEEALACLDIALENNSNEANKIAEEAQKIAEEIFKKQKPSEEEAQFQFTLDTAINAAETYA